MKILFSFSTVQTEKNSWKNWERQDWWFDVMNKIVNKTKMHHEPCFGVPQNFINFRTLVAVIHTWKPL